MTSRSTRADTLVGAFAEQARWCDRLGSPFTAALLRFLAEDLEGGGVMRALLPRWAGNPLSDVVPLRLAGALHALVLTGADGGLAACYPPQATRFDPERAGPIVIDALQRHRAHFESWLRLAPQTNEVRRSAALIGGFGEIARRTGLPLALREIGASAGLNLLWDRFHYRLGTRRFGPPDSPVAIDSDWRGAAPSLPARIEVADRAACDIAPIDVNDGAQATRLAAYVWADQQDRLQRLRAAVRLARDARFGVDAMDAGAWVEREFAAPRAGVASVLYHSIVWQYLPHATRRRIRDHLSRIGAIATPQAPIAWLRLEFLRANEPPYLSLTLWPHGRSERLAQAHPHGEWVQWRPQ